MTPKEKAIELVQKYFISVEVFYKQDSIPNILKAPMTRESVKQCALIAIDFMIEIANQKDDNDRYYYFDLSEFDIDYLNKIKAEINAL